MKICELSLEQIKIGLRIRSLINPNKFGTIVKIDDEAGDQFSWILWDGDTKPFSGIWWNDCECEVVNED